jgi:hypothetical protein
MITISAENFQNCIRNKKNKKKRLLNFIKMASAILSKFVILLFCNKRVTFVICVIGWWLIKYEGSNLQKFTKTLFNIFQV